MRQLMEVMADVAVMRREELLQARRKVVLAVKQFTNGELPAYSTFRRTCNKCQRTQSPYRGINQPCEYCGCNVILWQ